MWAGSKERIFGEVIDGFEVTPGQGLYALTARGLFEARASSTSVTNRAGSP